MIKCFYCGKEIRSKTYWARYEWLVGHQVNVCNDCAAAKVDEHHSWGLLLQFND